MIVGDVRGDRRPPRSGEVTHSVTVRVEDVRAHCDRARENGARILMEPTDFEYGERQYSADKNPKKINNATPHPKNKQKKNPFFYLIRFRKRNV